MIVKGNLKSQPALYPQFIHVLEVMIGREHSQIVQPSDSSDLCIGAGDRAAFGFQLSPDTPILLSRHHIKVQERDMIQ